MAAADPTEPNPARAEPAGPVPAPWLSVDRARAEQLRALLLGCGWTVATVSERLGDQAAAALLREQVVPAHRVLADRSTADGLADDAVALLTRLFLLAEPVPRAAAELALPLPELLSAGLVAVAGATVHALLDLGPYAEADDAPNWLVVSDLGSGLGTRRGLPVPRDHVLGIGGASTTLAQLVPRDPVELAVDLGTGCGVQTLHLAQHATKVIATDISTRALACAAATFSLSGIPAQQVELRGGSLLEPLADLGDANRRYADLIVANPPFVIGPVVRATYRDAGLAGDDLVPLLLAGLPQLLTPGSGRAVMLLAWLHRRGQPWQERLRGWLEPALELGASVSVVQREVLDPTSYVELWLRDAGDHLDPGAYQRGYHAWLDWLDDQDAEAVGFGWVVIERDGLANVALDEHYGEVEQPLGPEIGRAAEVRAQALAPAAELLAAHLRIGSDVAEQRVYQPGAEDPVAIELRRSTGLRQVLTVDTVGAALAGALDGSISVAAVLDAIAELTDSLPEQVRAAGLDWVRRMLEQGFLLPK